MGGVCDVYGGGKKCVQACGWKSCRKEMCGGPSHRWESGVKVDVKEMGWEGVDRIQVLKWMLKKWDERV